MKRMWMRSNKADAVVQKQIVPVEVAVNHPK
jgi:hypothetical protein